MKTAEVELACVNFFNARKNLIIPNVSWGFVGLHYEADLVVVTKAGYAKEIEIKINRGDLVKDKSKKHDHDCKKFKELYFAIPEKLLKYKEHIPERAGILVCQTEVGDGKSYYCARLERSASKNGAGKLTIQEKYELARLGALRIWNLKKRIIESASEKI